MSYKCILSSFIFYLNDNNQYIHSFPTRRSSDLCLRKKLTVSTHRCHSRQDRPLAFPKRQPAVQFVRRIPLSRSTRSEEHTSELQSRLHLVCRLLLEKKKIVFIDINSFNIF